MKKIIIIGGGGHALSCIDIILSLKKYKIKGYLSKERSLSLPAIYKRLGDNNYINEIKKNENVFIGFANIGKTKLKKRIQIFNFLKKKGCNFPIIISKKSYISSSARVGEGTIIMNGSVINANAVIGKNCIINSMSLIEHDVIIGDHTHVSTGVIINGNTKVCRASFIGSGSIIRNNLNLKKKFYPMGSIVKK